MPDIRGAEVAERLVDVLLASYPERNPWTPAGEYVADHQFLERLLSIPVRQGSVQQSGLLSRSADAWVAQELRSAGFGENEVWPRRTRPRVLPQPLAAIEAAAKGAPFASIRRLLRGSAQANLLGQYYRKQVDVVIADWDRGAELIVSTKSMLSSYWNNLRNRFEEFVGDAKNLRGRYPLAAIGILFVVRSTILDEAGAFEFLVDMLNRLRSPDLYDTAGLVVAEWSDTNFGSWNGVLELGDDTMVSGRLEEPPVVALLVDRVPQQLAPAHFLADLVQAVLSRTPVTYHVRSRELKLRRPLPVQLEEQATRDELEEPPTPS
jgi:hypothetical protein